MAELEENSATRYRLSGKMGSAALFLPLIALICGTLGGYLLGLINFKINAQFNCKVGLITSGLAGWLFGLFCIRIAKFLKCRNVLWFTASMALGSLASMHAYSVGLIISALNNQNVPYDAVELWSNPVSTYHLLRNWYEFLLVQEFSIAMAAFSVWSRFRQEVYCESCGKWLDIKKSIHCLPYPRTKPALAAFKSGDLSYVAQHPVEQHTRLLRTPFIRLNYVNCDGCGSFGAYRLLVVKDEIRYSRLRGMMDVVARPFRIFRSARSMCPVMVLNKAASAHLAVLLTKPTPPSLPIKKTVNKKLMMKQ